MALLQKILVAVNGSGASLNALREGCRLSRAERARLLAVTVAPPYEGDLSLVGVRNLQDVMAEPCDQAFAASESIAREEGIVAEHLGTTGEISARIVEVAAEYRCDLIVMGYGQRPAIWRLLASSVVPGVIAASPCDVLVVPQDTRFEWQTFLVVIRDPRLAVRTAERALDFARSYGARLLVAVAPTEERSKTESSPIVAQHEVPGWTSPGFLQDLLQTAESNNVRVQTRALRGHPLAATIDLARREHADLTILDRTTLDSRPAFLSDRLTALALQRFPCPVLVVR
jgi:nucleotide-binding universal stress UspA family protein